MYSYKDRIKAVRLDGAKKRVLQNPKIHTQKRETPPGLSLRGVFGFP